MTRINFVTVKQVRESSGNYDVPRKVSKPADISNVVNIVLQLQDEAVEKFGMIALDTKNQINGIHIISVGSLSATIVHPRDVFKQALLNNAASIAVFHNHPSGDPTPSEQDVTHTNRLAEAGGMIGIDLLDHVIVGGGRYVSFKECGLL